MSFILIQLLCLLVALVSLDMLMPKKWMSYTLRTFGVLFFLTEITSVFMGDALLDYKFYIHMNLAIIKDKAGFFIKEIFMLMLGGIILFLGIGFFVKRAKSFFESYKYILVGLCFGSFLGMNVEAGIMNNVWQAIDFEISKNKGFDEALSQIGYDDFVKKEDLQASKGKNIIVIMLESVENSFLQDNLAYLTPELRKLSNKYTYYNMLPAEGSDFTTAGIYTYLTGIPMFFKNHGNDVFNFAWNSKMPSITHVLNKAGYKQLYLMGNPEFAGVKTMLSFFDVEVKSEKNYDKKYTVDHWGLHDKDLFELAGKEVKKLNEAQQPFAFYMSTISTHPPNGIFDPRMTKEIPAQKSKLEMMVASVDKHIGDFMRLLEEEGMLENTVVYIMPDHLLMGRMSEVVKKFEDPRSLYVITNSQTESYNPDQDILQIDVPKIILEGAKVSSNMSFLTDFIKGDKLSYILQNRLQLLQLNEASLIRKDRPKVNIVQDKIRAQGHLIQLKSVAWNKEYYGKASTILLGMKKVEAKRGVNLIRYDSSKYYVEHFDTYDDTIVAGKLVERLKDLTINKKYFSILVHDSAGDALGHFKNELNEIGFRELSKIRNRQAYIAFSRFGFVSEAIRPNKLYFNTPFEPKKSQRDLNTIQNEAKDPFRLIAHAGGAIDGHTYTNCLEAMNQSYDNGFRLFELDIMVTSDGHYVAGHDWNKWRDECNYGGDVPVSLEVFKNTKYKGLYTPMDMNDINDWFDRHPDAILVSDKVNDPQKFVAQFIDKSRLMMELFSLDAVKKAKEVGMNNIILSENCIKDLKGDKIEALKNLDIKYLAVSRRTIDKNKANYLAYKKAGLKVFAFHVNFDALKDEAYMLREGMDYCYGYYSDFHVLK